MRSSNNSRILWTITLLITIFSLSLPTYAIYSGGTGEPNDPYQISTAEDLVLLGESPEDYDKHFILTADIDMDSNLPGHRVFDSAVIARDTDDVESGFQGTPFAGVFDGRGHIITHLAIAGDLYLGLFGQLASGAEVRDLGLVDVNITNSRSLIGGLVGVNNGSIVRSYSTGEFSGEALVGGLVGRNDGSVATSYSTGEVSGDLVGGLVGWNTGTILDSHSDSTVDGKIDAGGLVGLNRDAGSITGSHSTGVITGDLSAGGLVGRSDKEGSITMSFSTASVNGNAYVGGLVGHNDHTSSISNSYSTGAVNGGVTTGGLVGNNSGSIIACYCTGAPSGGPLVGGLVGTNLFGSVTSCFWDMDASGLVSSQGGAGKATTEMQTANTFLDAGWDFTNETTNGVENIWWIDEGNDYPRLWWERMVWFSDYMPLDPNEYGVKTFEWVYGQTGEYTGRIGGFETVSYLSGPITGVQIIENNNTLVGTNDGLNVSFLASGEWVLSTDPNLTVHPPVWTFSSLYDDMIIDQGVWYLVKKDMSEWQVVDSQQLLIDLQDITVPQGHHKNTVVFWYLDTAYSFTPLDFHRKELDLGITLPLSSQTIGYSVTGFDIFAVNTGLIAHGDIDAATGSLNDLAVLKQIE